MAADRKACTLEKISCEDLEVSPFKGYSWDEKIDSGDFGSGCSLWQRRSGGGKGLELVETWTGERRNFQMSCSDE